MSTGNPTAGQERIQTCIRAGHRCIRIVTTEEDEALEFVREAALALVRPVWMWSAVHGVYEGLLDHPTPVTGTENAAAGLFRMAQVNERAVHVVLDLSPHLAKDDRQLRAWRELIARCDQTGSCVVMIDCAEDAPAIVGLSATRVDMALPRQAEIESIIRQTVNEMNRESRVEAPLKKSELAAIVRNLQGLTRRQIRRAVTDVMADDRRLDINDLNALLAAKRSMIQSSGLLEFVEAPVELDDVGGLDSLKQWLLARRAAMGDDAEKFGLAPPRGVLLLGVQGAGKSLAAKAIATAWRRPLLRMDVGALYDRYVGESERKLREALKQSEVMAPIVLWIDEIEKAFASAASQSSDGGLSRRMFGSLLTWMQEHKAPVFLAATANDIEALPPELLRKGRFDEIFFVDLPGSAARSQIFQIHLRRRKRDPGGFDLAALVGASEGFSGAEIEQGIVSAMHKAFSTGKDIDTPMVVQALAESPPLSVTMAEKVNGLREWARGRCVPAD